MRKARFLLAVVVALAATGCMRHEPDDVAGRGLFNSRPSAPQAYAQQPLQPSLCCNTVAPPSATPQYGAGGSYVAAPEAMPRPRPTSSPTRSMPATNCASWCSARTAFRNTYIVDAGGNVNLPLIGSVPARGILDAAALATDRRAAQAGLRARAACDGGGRDLPAVLHPRRGDHAGAVSLRRRHDGGEGDRDRRRLCAARLKKTVELTRTAHGQQIKSEVPLDYPLRPGDTVLVKERWF